MARAILQRSKNNNNAATRGIGPAPSPPQSGAPVGLACVRSTANNAPNVPSVRQYVGLISQLLEELCPNRSDPNIRSCEDRCLAALQMAVVHCLKIVRQKRLGEPPQPGNNSGGGFQQSSSSQKAIAYQPFNPPTVGGTMSIPPQQCGFSPQQGGGGLPPQQGGGCGFPQQQSSCQRSVGGFPPQQGGGGGFPQQQGSCQRSAGGFPQPGPPQQEPGGFPIGQGGSGFSPCGMRNQQGGAQQSRGGFPPQMQSQQMVMVRSQNSQMMGGSLDQRLASIPEPPPCPFGAANTRPHNTVSSFLQRDPLEGTLEQRLAAIPEPPVCHVCGQGPQSQPGGGFCGGGFGQRHMPEDNGLNVKLFPPAAGGYSDGIGGAKIKGFAGQANTDKDVMSLSSREGTRTAGSLDGVGGRKVKDLED